VFCGPLGQLLGRATIRHGFGRVLKQAGLPHFQLRETRHSFVSVLSDSGVSIEAIADAAGHINSKVTKAVYRHQIADQVAAAAAA
jgi:integrase